MKKILLATAFLVVSAGAANAQISAVVGINQPAYVPATNVYYHDRSYDWGYWRPAPRPVVVEHRTYVDYDRDDRRHWGHKHGRGHGKHHGHHH